MRKSSLYDLLDKESIEIFPLFLREYEDEIIKSKEEILIYDGRCKHYWNTNYNRIRNQGAKCPFCANKKVWKGFNDIATTDPWMKEIMKNKEDANKYTRHSNKKIDWVCPICKKDILGKCSNEVWKKGLACPNCSEGKSYPEKFMANLLDELNLSFVSQYQINGYPYIYDFYLNNYNCIIETHGNQHYDEHGFGSIHKQKARSLKEEQENDEIKEELAKSLGFNYIIIDCRKSDCNYIKESIIKTDFCNITNTNIITLDFTKIHIKTLSSNRLVACKLYDNGVEIKKIAEKLHSGTSTIYKYLSDGAKNGICTYTKKNN